MCMHLNHCRIAKTKEDLIPDIVYRIYNKAFIVPTTTESENVTIVNIVPEMILRYIDKHILYKFYI